MPPKRSSTRTNSKMRKFPPKPNLKALSIHTGNVKTVGSKGKFKKASIGNIKSQGLVVATSRAQQNLKSKVKIDAKETDKDSSGLQRRKTLRGVDEVVEDLIRDANPASMFELSDCDAVGKKGGCDGSGTGLEKDGSEKKKKNKKFPFFQAFAHQESADKHRIEYHVEHPIRVAIRLEYLMGTSTVYLNDMSYINRLHRAIRKEEERIHKEITEKREGAEKARVKKLVLDGKMAPPPGMEDLLNHPVFKVNKMLETMEELETSVRGDYRPAIEEKITSVEPFQHNDTGEYFKNLHQGLDVTWVTPPVDTLALRPPKKGRGSKSKAMMRKASKWSLSRKGSRMSVRSATSRRSSTLQPEADFPDDVEFDAKGSQSLTWAQLQEIRQKEEEEKRQQEKREKMREMETLYPDLIVQSDMNFSDEIEEEEEEEEPVYDLDEWKRVVGKGRLAAAMDEEDEEDEVEAENTEEGAGRTDGGQGSCREDQKTLRVLRRIYKIDDKVKLCSYTPYENQILTRYIDEAPDVQTLFDNAEQIRQAYHRETMVADDFLRDLTKRMNG